MFALRHISKSFSGQTVLNDISLTIHHSEVAGLIGANGAGKTTLLQVLAGITSADSGIREVNGEIGYVPQQPILGRTVKDSFTPSTPGWQIEYALSQVDLTSVKLTTPVENLSGGQRTRLSFAIAMAQDPVPNLLILDEPTNNLDADGLLWLRNFVISFEGAVVVASHDRTFINHVATKILELDNGRLQQYQGNYDFYRKQKEIEKSQEQERYQQYIQKHRRLERYKQQKLRAMQSVSNARYEPDKTGKSKISFNASRNSMQTSFGKQLKAINNKFEQLESVEKPKREVDYKVQLHGLAHQSKLVLRLTNISKVFDLTVLTNINFEIRGGERLQVVGPNGSGKSTLLNIAAGQLTPDTGDVQIGANITVGYFSQEIDGLDHNQTGLANLSQTSAPTTDIFRQARSLDLTKDDLLKSVANLSRGQQAKLSFTKLLLAKHQLLILDEPTNHLDIPTREHIEAALLQYDAAIVFATHDHYFAKKISPSRIIELGEKNV